MLIVSVLILSEAALVIRNVGGALQKISGRPPDEQLEMWSGRKPWDGFSVRNWCVMFFLAGGLCLGYAIHGL